MHFRHFLISGLMVGAALLLPDNAFAEKNEVRGQSQTASVQADRLVKAEKAVVQPSVPAKAKNAKKTAVLPEPVSKNQGAVKQHASSQAPQQAASEKRAAAPKSLPNLAVGNSQSVLKKTEKAVEAPGQMKKADAQESNQGLNKDKQTSKNELNPSYHKEINSKESLKRFDSHREDSRVSIPKKMERYEPKATKPESKDKLPADKEDNPIADRASNQTQRSNCSGGSSNDRSSLGLSTISTLDKWFEWNKYYEMTFVQLYLSRYALMSNQWVNAPPAPPPQGSSFIKTVNQS
ncbi:hypothetical protein ACSU64_20650 [Bacillaceae bacterium C204]|uniref:hypothetical protein n=1 Tax=Neobacillus sp. 204 TaxID=3383351 RepID=UPI00397A0CBA